MSGFYEPLNESLATLTLRTMPAMRPSATNSRHPEPERPYFEEFVPLLSPKKPGAVGYRPEFAYETFFLGADSKAPELASYLRSLVSLAQSQGKTPAFKFCRSLGRVGWMRRTFPAAVHVLILRDPWSQWMSGWTIFCEELNPYFIVRPLRTLLRHRDRDVVACAMEMLKVRAKDYDLPPKHAACCEAVVKTPRHRLYRGFLAFWACTAATALAGADVLIESDRLSLPDYRAAVERAIADRTGMAIDLAGAHRLDRPVPDDEPFDAQRAQDNAIDALASLEHLLGLPPQAGHVLRDKLSPRPQLPIAI